MDFAIAQAPTTAEATIYPNPGMGIFYVNWIPIKELEIYNISGDRVARIINSSSGNYFDLSVFSAGYYLLKITGFNNERAIEKLLILK